MKRKSRLIGVARSKFLKTLFVTLAAVGLCADLGAMIFRPEQGAMWDPSVLWHEGKYYAFMMYNKDGRDGLAAPGHCLLATSKDGVHWADQGPVIDEQSRPDGTHFFKCFVAKCGDKFIMDHGVRRQQGQDLMRFYQSKDLRHWEYITSTEPDGRWYSRQRWDHMYLLPKEEGKPESGYWGYVVAVPKQGVDLPAMMQSPDGRKWEVLPPAKTEWGATPPRNHYEYGGCERIGGKYYLIGGTYLGGKQGYPMSTFVADGPRGPFRPDAEAFRLCGNPNKEVSWLAAWVRGKDEILISNYASMQHGERAPWLLPLRKPVVDKAGHLRMGWWQGNEAIKGKRLALGKQSGVLNGEGKPGSYDLRYLEATFYPAQGLVLEGRLKARTLAPGDPGAAKPTAGFVIQENSGQAMAVQLGIGRPEDRETHIGRLTTGADGQWVFSSEDVTGQGCATVTGIEDRQVHTFRLLCRMEMFELYIDDLLMQTYTHRPGSGKVGLLVCNARAEFSDLRAWTMSFPATNAE